MKSEYLAEVKVITIPNYAIGLLYRKFLFWRRMYGRNIFYSMNINTKVAVSVNIILLRIIF